MSATIIFKDPGGYCKYKIKDTFYDTTSNFIYLSCVFLQPLVSLIWSCMSWLVILWLDECDLDCFVKCKAMRLPDISHWNPV